jgi:peptide/nickel transport system permease protein
MSDTTLRLPLPAEAKQTTASGRARGYWRTVGRRLPPLCRVAEAATTQIRSRDFVEAARASGASNISIILHHVLRNVLAPVLIYASSLISVAILLAAGLSFLGWGVEPPTSDWGLMLSALRQSIYVQPLICALPGAAIFICSLSFNLVSDGLRQAMDIRA